MSDQELNELFISHVRGTVQCSVASVIGGVYVGT